MIRTTTSDWMQLQGLAKNATDCSGRNHILVTDVRFKLKLFIILIFIIELF